MHYKNGREAKVGDMVLHLENGRLATLGMLVQVTTGSTTCNGRVLPNHLNNSAYVTIGDCLHADDVGTIVSGLLPL